MKLPEASSDDVLAKIKEEAELLGVDPSRLLASIGEVFGTICLGQKAMDDIRIKSGQSRVASTRVRDYAQSQELSRTLGLEHAELRGASSAERRIEDGIRAAQTLMDAQDLTWQQPDLQLVQPSEAQVA